MFGFLKRWISLSVTSTTTVTINGKTIDHDFANCKEANCRWCKTVKKAVGDAADTLKTTADSLRTMFDD